MKYSRYIENLYFPVKTRDEERKLKDDIHAGRFERISRDYEFKKHVPVIVIHTKGKGSRETFDFASRLFADFGKIGEKVGEIYLYNEERTIGYPRKFVLDKDRILLDLKGE